MCDLVYCCRRRGPLLRFDVYRDVIYWCRSALQARMPPLMAICAIADASYPCHMPVFRCLLFNRFLRQLALQGTSMHVQRTCGGRYVAIMLGEYLLQVFPLQALYR